MKPVMILQSWQHVSKHEPLLVNDQRAVYNDILDLVRAKKSGFVFIDAPGGTGKNFVINLLLAKICLEKRIAFAVASSGIASTLFDGGRTEHSVFKLPFNLTHSDWPVCNITKGSREANVIKQSSVIVWDECTMTHKKSLEALDRMLEDLK